MYRPGRNRSVWCPGFIGVSTVCLLSIVPALLPSSVIPSGARRTSYPSARPFGSSVAGTVTFAFR
jgi:hypothetical protein